MGQLVAIFLKRFHGGPMDSQESAELLPGTGLKGNADRGGRRQVTLVSLERWEELMNQVGADLGPERAAGKPGPLQRRPREQPRTGALHRLLAPSHRGRDPPLRADGGGGPRTSASDEGALGRRRLCGSTHRRDGRCRRRSELGRRHIPVAVSNTAAARTSAVTACIH